ALEPGEQLSEEAAVRISCSLTAAEHAAVHVTSSGMGHTFRVYIVASWLSKLVSQAQEEQILSGDEIARNVDYNLGRFNGAWLSARQIAYSSMPESITHMLWILANMINFVLPWEYVSVCRWMTWLPSIFITISFHGIIRISSAMENPFGFDEDDIDLGKMVEHFDEEMCIVMHYAALDDVAGENIYRSLQNSDNLVTSTF
ncbi:unnamed protein product, partial [Polarella glacialis]